MLQLTDYISNDFKAIDSQRDVHSVQDFFIDNPFSHFPIVKEGVFIGNINSDDVETFDGDKLISDYLYATEIFFARTDTMWLDLLELFARHRSNIVPVLNKQNIYAGYFEIQDVIRVFIDTPFLKEQGGIIVVEKETSDYSMGQIVQIVESTNAKVLGVLLTNSSGDKVQVTIKVSIGSLNEIIQTFRRYNYEIISEHSDDSYINGLKDRSDYLTKYMNI